MFACLLAYTPGTFSRMVEVSVGDRERLRRLSAYDVPVHLQKRLW